jgi:hypothetical protein
MLCFLGNLVACGLQARCFIWNGRPMPWKTGQAEQDTTMNGTLNGQQQNLALFVTDSTVL